MFVFVIAIEFEKRPPPNLRYGLGGHFRAYIDRGRLKPYINFK